MEKPSQKLIANVKAVFESNPKAEVIFVAFEMPFLRKVDAINLAGGDEREVWTVWRNDFMSENTSVASPMPNQNPVKPALQGLDVDDAFVFKVRQMIFQASESL